MALRGANISFFLCCAIVYEGGWMRGEGERKLAEKQIKIHMNI